MKREMEPYQLIERSIIKKYRKELWTPFIVALKDYRLVNDGDRIAVCISGGKDSMLMAKLMQELQRHSDVPFELVFLVMDPGYNEINRQKIESNAELLHIPVTIFESNIFSVANNTDKNPCYLCARKIAMLFMCEDEKRTSVCICKGAGLQQNRAGPPLQRRHRDDRYEYVLRLPAAGHAAHAPQHQLPRHDPHPPDVLHPRGRHSGVEALQ